MSVVVEALWLDGNRFQGVMVDTEKAKLLLIQGSRGFLGCGYLNVATANKLGEHVALVTGVGSFDDMLTARVIQVSDAAAESGVAEGMSGQEALALLA